MDLFTREIVGWHLSSRHTQELTITALKDALASRKLAKPKFIHSDQGSEYLAKEYIRFAKEWQIQISMSRKASPWENGYQESFYNNFKTDLGLEFDRYNTTGEFIEAVHQTINYYNRRRIHTSLKTTPDKYYKQQLLENMPKKTGT
jgi:transposase InsO family protein